jgi:hypothetical protein
MIWFESDWVQFETGTHTSAMSQQQSKQPHELCDYRRFIPLRARPQNPAAAASATSLPRRGD